MSSEVSALEAWNQAVFLTLNAGPGTSHCMLVLADWTANGLIYSVPVALTLMWLLGGFDARATALRAVVVSGFALGLGQVIGFFWPHARPFMIGLGHTWMSHVADASLPSDHMTVFAAVGLWLLVGGRAILGASLLVLCLAVAWARIFIGVHFPLDMLAAFVVAGLAHVMVAPAWHRVGSRTTQSAEHI